MEQKQSTPKDSIFDIKEFNVDKYKAKIEQARNCLFLACVFVVLDATFVTVFRSENSDLFYLWLQTLVVAGAFLVLGMIAETKPYTALIWGLIIYLIYFVVHLFSGPHIAGKESISKILIIFFLARGIKNAATLKNIKEIRDAQK